ncbi:unnamed protein product, partial [Iphiclides podalirius]
MSLDVNLSEPDEFNCVELHSCIDNVARMKNIDDFAYHVEFACGKSENFVANVFRVTITDANDSEHKVSVIVKTLVNTTRQELFQELHKREVRAYADVIPKFQSVQMKLAAEDRLALPVCILSYTQKGNEVLILEDLLLDGYEYDTKLFKLKNMDSRQVGTILSELAKFHALSVVLERADEENFSTLKDEFEDVLFQESFLNKSKLRDCYSESYEASVNLVIDLDAKNKLLNARTKMLDLLRNFTRPRKFNVLCHGDCWVNNFMFKRRGNLMDTKICFLDFQAMRYSSPATDIIYFLYLCTDSVFRSKYMEDVLHVYYDSFESFLKLFEIDSNTIYSRDLFLDDIKEIMPFGFLIALVELRIVTATNEDKNIDETSLDSESSSCALDDKMFLGIRVNDAVSESIENGVLNRICDLL